MRYRNPHHVTRQQLSFVAMIKFEEFFQFCPNRFYTVCVHSSARVDEILFVDHNMANVTFVGTSMSSSHRCIR